MKKIVLAMSLVLGATTAISLLPQNLIPNSVSLKADIIDDNINLIRKMSNEQDLMANAVELYIELYANTPTNINTLKNAGLIDSSFSFSGSFSVSGNTITVSSSYVNAQTYQKDFYLNNFNRGRVVSPTVTGNIFATKYYLNKEAVNTKTFIGVVDYIFPTTPSTTTTGKTWYSTRLKKMFTYQSGWKSLDVKKLYIVKSTAELPTTATENDGAIVLTTTLFEKYLYVSSNWYKIETVPFNYNTGF